MKPSLIWLYIINLVFLTIHEIDSAYQQEWLLFGIPGGISAFLLLHIPLIMLALTGLLFLAQNSRTGIYFSLGFSLCGIAAAVIHGIFIGSGHPEFTSTVSVGVILCCALTSLPLFSLSLRGIIRKTVVTV